MIITLMVLANLLLAGLVIVDALIFNLLRKRPEAPAVSTPSPEPVEAAQVAPEPRHALLDAPEPLTWARRLAGLPGNTPVTPAPMIGDETLRDYLVHLHHRDGVWGEVVTEFYKAAAGVPEVFSYFAQTVERDGMEVLQRHFLNALLLVTHRGLSAGVIRGMEDRHADVRDEDGRPITPEVYDLVISTLVGILVAKGVPQDGIGALGDTIAPLRDVIANRGVVTA